MRRNTPNRSLLSNNNDSDVNYTANFCPITPKPGNQSQTIEPNEHEKLIVRYRELTKELKTLRGKLLCSRYRSPEIPLN